MKSAGCTRISSNGKPHTSTVFVEPRKSAMPSPAIHLWILCKIDGRRKLKLSLKSGPDISSTRTEHHVFTHASSPLGMKRAIIHLHPETHRVSKFRFCPRGLGNACAISCTSYGLRTSTIPKAFGFEAATHFEPILLSGSLILIVVIGMRVGSPA